MRTPYAELATSQGGSSIALTTSGGQAVVVGTRVVIETDAQGWALKIDGDYSLVYDNTDGLLMGDLEQLTAQDYPRLDFYVPSRGVSQRVASLSKTGRLQIAAGATGRLQVVSANETDTLPTGGMTFFTNVAITKDGIFTDKLNEVWFVTDNDENYITDQGMLIAIQP